MRAHILVGLAVLTALVTIVCLILGMIGIAWSLILLVWQVEAGPTALKSVWLIGGAVGSFALLLLIEWVVNRDME